MFDDQPVIPGEEAKSRRKKWLSRLLDVAIIITVLIGFALQQKNSDKSALALDLSLKETKRLQTVNGQLVQETSLMKARTSAQLKIASDSIFKLNKEEDKRIKEVTRLSKMLISVKLKEPITAGFVDTFHPDVESMSCDSLKAYAQNCVTLPKEFRYVSDTINFYGAVLRNSIRLDGLVIPNTFYSRDVVKKSGFMNLKRSTATQIYNTNSMFSVDSAAVFYVDKTPSRWVRTGKPVAAASVATVITIIVMKAILSR